MKLNVEMVYVCHYKKLKERRICLLNQLEKNSIDKYIFVDSYDKDSWDIEEITKDYPNITNPKNNMTHGEMSLAMKHAWIVEDSFKNNYSSVLVLEDDAVLCENFTEKFNNYKNQLPNDWDIGWVGSCLNLREPQVEGKNVYLTKRGSRCTHAFCLSHKFCSRFHEHMKKINKQSDMFYNYLISSFNINNYWFQPPLALQSLDFSSSLNADPNHKWDPQEMG